MALVLWDRDHLALRLEESLVELRDLQCGVQIAMHGARPAEGALAEVEDLRRVSKQEETAVIELSQRELRLPADRRAFVGPNEGRGSAVAALAPAASPVVPEPGAVFDDEVAPLSNHLQALQGACACLSGTEMQQADRAGA